MPIKNAMQYRDAANELASYDELERMTRSLQANASAMKAIGRLSDGPVKDVYAHTTDLLADLKYRRRQIEADIAEYEATESYGSPDSAARDKAAYLQGVL